MSDLASSAGKDDLLHVKDLLSSKVGQGLQKDEVTSGDIEATETKVFMVRRQLDFGPVFIQSTQPASAAHCNIAFGELVINFSDDHISQRIDTIIPVLVDLLNSVAHIDFDQSLSWQGRPSQGRLK